MNHRLFRRFENQFEFVWPFDGRPLLLEWKREDANYFFRPQGEKLSLIWCCRLWSGFDSSKAPAHKAIAEQLRFRSFWRLVPLSEEECVLWNWKASVWTRMGISRGAAFSLPSSAFPSKMGATKQLFFNPGQTLLTMQQLREEETSDLNRARTWLENFQDNWSFLELDTYSLNELQRLLKAIVVLFRPSHLSSREVAFFERAVNNKVRIRCSLFPVPQPLLDVLNNSYKIQFIPRLQINTIISSHSCSELPRIVCSAESTQHERLEALLLWRDFLRGKLPDAEIETLLRS